MNRTLLTTLVLSSTAACTAAANANLVFMRGYTNQSNNQHTQLLGFNSIADMAMTTTSNAFVSLAFNTNVAFVADYYFTDGTEYYRTSQNSSGINQIYRYGTSIQNVLTGNVLSTHNLSQLWATTDDFWADSEGNFYRNNSDSGSSQVKVYTSFANLLSNTGTVYNYGVTYGTDDSFWSYGGKFYRTNTNSGNVTGIAEYASFTALINRQVTTTYTANGSAKDMFMTIPAPGAIALLGLAGLASRRRR